MSLVLRLRLVVPMVRPLQHLPDGAPLVGTVAAFFVFAVALLASGQSSTITGTLAGQVVMEGFMHWRISPWLRRLITRLCAVTPAIILIGIRGDRSTTPTS